MDFAYSERLADLVMQARIWWGLAVASVVLLAFVAIRIGQMFSSYGRTQRKSRTTAPFWLRVHQTESATASMEYLLVLVPFLIIVMTVWQLAFMFNAQLHVGYSVYAAARSAAVMIPADLDGEKEGILNKQGQGGATKWSRIRKAAIPGTLAISPGEFTTGAGVALNSSLRRGGIGNLGGTPNLAAIGSRMTLMTAHYGDVGILGGTRFLRAANKNLYAEKMTSVLINEKDHRASIDLSGSDPSSTKGDVITVTVNYIFWLQVPYVGAMLEAAFAKRFKNPLTGEYIFLSPYPSVPISETISMTTWPRKRAIEPCN